MKVSHTPGYQHLNKTSLPYKPLSLKYWLLKLWAARHAFGYIAIVPSGKGSLSGSHQTSSCWVVMLWMHQKNIRAH